LISFLFMAGALFLCCCCCGIFSITPLIILLLIIVNFFTSFYYATTYYEALWEFLDYVFSLFTNVFWKVWEAIYFLTIYITYDIIPYICVLVIITKFYEFIIQKIAILKRNKKEMNKEQKSLQFYVERLKIMSYTLLYLFGFLIGLRLVTWLVFSDSFLMEMITYVNFGFFLSLLMFRGDFTIKVPQNKGIFVYNCALIFLSSFIIDDVFHLLTGSKFLY